MSGRPEATAGAFPWPPAPGADDWTFAIAAYVAFVAALFVGARWLPGTHRLGFPQPDGARKTYKLNGMALWVGTHIVLGWAVMTQGLRLGRIVPAFWALFWVANAAAVLFTAWLWLSARGRVRGRGLVRDLWYGLELNPTAFGVDLKVFAYQPSLIGLGLLNVGFAARQWELHGELTPQMMVYQALWWLYLTSHYHHESGILSMWDVIAERFGFMLVWGDLVLVPFFYSIGGWFLLHVREPTPWAVLAPIVALHLVGLWVFRGANAQKDRFKRDPQAVIWGRPAEALGGRLLVSGFWGFARKINYTGEICVYLSFALCTGWRSVVPYLLPLWLCVLLPHRAHRDEKRCREKYGALWQEYTRRARFRMIPFVY